MKTAHDQALDEAVDVRLYYKQQLPYVCARCGLAASTRIEYDLSEMPIKRKPPRAVHKAGFLGAIRRIVTTDLAPRRSGSGSSVMMGGMLGGAIGGAIFGATGAMLDASVQRLPVVQIPFCEEHRDFLHRKTVRHYAAQCIVIVGILILTAAAIATLVVFASRKSSPAGGWEVEVVLTWLAWLVITIGLFFLWRSQHVDLDRVEPLAYHEHFMVIGGVSPRFAAGVASRFPEEGKDVDKLLDRTMTAPKKGPNAVILHVRVCGSPGWAITRGHPARCSTP